MNDLLAKALITRPTTRDEIADWVKFFLGFDVHRTVRCTHVENDGPHCCQLDYVEEAFLCKYSSCVYMASRYGGKSYAAAIVNIIDAHFNPGIKIAVAAFLRDQSDYIYQYMCDFLKKMALRIGRDVKAIAKITKDDITFANGSLVSFYSGGSKASVKGWHGERLQIDEADLFKMPQFDGIANSLSASGEYPTRLDVLSTNYQVAGDGVILKQIEKYKEFNRTRNTALRPCRIFKSCLLDVMEKCNDDFQCTKDKVIDGKVVMGKDGQPEVERCPMWSYCKGKAKTGEGFYSLPRVFETQRDSSIQVFESQMLLLRPSSEFAYFHNFDIVKNVCDPNRELDPIMRTYSIWDFGGASNPHACLIMQKQDRPNTPDFGCYYVVDEFLGMGALEHLIDRVKAAYPNATDFECFADPKGKSKDQVLASRSYLQVLRENHFYPRTKATKREKSAHQVFQKISPADGKPRLKINKRCVTLLKQIYAAECVLFKGKPTDELMDTKKDDCLDCLRYCVSWTDGTYSKHNGSKVLRWF